MLTFSMSYLVRVLCDTFVINYNAMSCFKSIMIDQFMGVPYDLVPILLIICLHRRNLNSNQRNSAMNGLNSRYSKKLMYTDEDDALMRQLSESSSSSQITTSLY